MEALPEGVRSGGWAELHDRALGMEPGEIEAEQGLQPAGPVAKARAFEPEDVVALGDRRRLAALEAQRRTGLGVFDTLDDLLVREHGNGSLP
jgi:hypothetical protein